MRSKWYSKHGTVSWTSRDDRKWRQNLAKKRQTTVKMAQIMAKTWHQITGPKTITQSIKLNIQHWRPSLHAVLGFHLRNFVAAYYLNTDFPTITSCSHIKAETNEAEAFWQNHGIWWKSRFLRLPCFCNFLLCLWTYYGPACIICPRQHFPGQLTARDLVFALLLHNVPDVLYCLTQLLAESCGHAYVSTECDDYNFEAYLTYLSHLLATIVTLWKVAFTHMCFFG